MKWTMKGILKPILLFCFLSSATLAYGDQTKMDHSTHTGKKIHESQVQGFQLAYHLLTLPGSHLHHLMVYIVDANRNAVTKGKVGYLVVGPNGGKQTVMAESMKTAFGGNVNFSMRGTYTIGTKAVFDDKKLLDKFVFEVK